MNADVLVLAVLGLLGVGLYGLLMIRNLIKLIIAMQIVVKGAALALVFAGYASGQTNLGQSLALTVIVADTVVVVVGLAMAVQVRQRMGTLDINALASLKR